MRLGAYPCVLKKGSKAYEAYGAMTISERHRHRFEFNNDYRETLEAAGLLISGTSPNNDLVEIIEIPDHPWYVGVQFHPEFKSTPRNPHPLFSSFIRAAMSYREKRNQLLEPNIKDSKVIEFAKKSENTELPANDETAKKSSVKKKRRK